MNYIKQLILVTHLRNRHSNKISRFINEKYAISYEKTIKDISTGAISGTYSGRYLGKDNTFSFESLEYSPASKHNNPNKISSISISFYYSEKGFVSDFINPDVLEANLSDFLEEKYGELPDDTECTFDNESRIDDNDELEPEEVKAIYYLET